MWISFSRHLPKWLVVKRIFTRQVKKQLAQFIEIISEREKKLAMLTSGFVYLLANPEFYSHLASWQVVIRTPALFISCKSGAQF
jgi:hypothetical protein